MADKSQHGRGHSPRSKKAKAKQRSAVMPPGQPVVAQMPKPAVSPRVAAPPASNQILSTKSRTTRYPYITAELKRIGIVAGIILAILIVLALVLS
ncbi:hypothetical protein ACFLWZ_04135 [Chloroflexota bacterium]